MKDIQRPKVALCLMGIVGAVEHPNGKGQPVDYRIGYHFHKKHIFDHNNVDVFIHSWSTDFEEELVKIYKPKKHLIEPQIEFNQGSLRKNSIKSRWYSNKISIELKKQYEIENNFEYDFVMVYRFDHILQKDLIFSNYDPNRFYASHRDDCTTDSCKCIGNPRYYDAWFFSNSSNMDKFSSLYDNWEHYNLNDPHKDCVHHINLIGLSTKLKFMLYEKTDHFTVRSRIKNCEYKTEFDVNKLEFFDIHNYERHKWV